MIEEESGHRGRAEEFIIAFKKGAEFTQDLLKENERLRFRVLELENSLAGRHTSEDSDQGLALDEPYKGAGAGETGYPEQNP